MTSKPRTGRDQAKGRNPQPFMPGEAARRRGEVPTGEERNKDYGKGRQSGAVEGKTREQLQEEELEMNERNH